MGMQSSSIYSYRERLPSYTSMLCSRLDGQVIVILMLGASGAGKTNLLKVLTGQDLPVGHGQQSGMSID